MLRRRGCMLGCSGVLLVCVITAGLGWFVVLPRTVDALRDQVANGVSTIVAADVTSRFSSSQLQQGQGIRLGFDAINVELADASQDTNNLDGLTIVGRGGDIIMSASVSSQTYEIAFTPRVDSTGHLDLVAVDEGGWWQQQTMKVLGGGFEKSINTWLDENNLLLTDVVIEPDTIVLSVVGR